MDDAGRTVRLDSPAQRVVSLIPARTDLILALGAADRLITRTAYDEDPRIAGLPSLGDALTPSVEWLVAQRPDLVIAWPDRQLRNVIERLEAADIAVYASRTESLEDVRRSIEHMGALLDLDAAADSLRQRFDDTIAQVRALVAGLPRPVVAYFIGLDPPMAAGPGTFIDELIEIAGGENVFADSPVLWPAVSVEETVVRQPDVVIVSTAGSTPGQVLEHLRSSPGWRSLEAVRAGNVYVVDASLFNRPGPRLMEALRKLAGVFHGS
ncbi:MAG: helical backbone metal receptor [Gemmatimonadetes bacterium]|nr:helical backbone metal receptor [Gemmatimonadota bacterium]